MRPKKSQEIKESFKITEKDKTIDQTLRPKTLDEFIGQEKLKENLKVFLEAAKKRNEQIEHVLLQGGPGLGKTTLAQIIAQEMKAKIHFTSGPALERAGDIAAIITNLEDKDVLFIDEIHRLNRTIEEILYPAMEEYTLNLIIGRGPSAQTLKLELPKFSIIGATTRPSLLSSPLRDRFGVTYELSFYKEEDLKKIIERSARILGIEIEEGASKEIARRARFTPRIANRLLKRVRDLAQVEEKNKIDLALTKKAFLMLEIDELGLTPADRRIIETIIKKFSGGPVGIKALACAVREEAETIEEIYEPYLIQISFLDRTPRGRIATNLAYQYFKYNKNLFNF